MEAPVFVHNSKNAFEDYEATVKTVTCLLLGMQTGHVLQNSLGV